MIGIDTLWVISKNVENDLKASNNAKKTEVWTSLEAIRGKNKKATMSSFDIQKHKKIKRQKTRQDRNVQRKRAKALDSPTVQQKLSQSSSSSEDPNQNCKPLGEKVK